MLWSLSRSHAQRQALCWLLPLVAVITPLDTTGGLPPPTDPPLQLTLNLTTASGVQVPADFLGYAFEYNDTLIAQLNTPTFQQLITGLNQAGTGPLVFRLGGASVENLYQVPSQSFWQALVNLQALTGGKFIVEVNFKSANLVFSANHIYTAQAMLPADSLLGFELGNEPTMYDNKPPGWYPEGYLSDADAFAGALQAALPTPFALIGPASQYPTLPPQVLEEFISRQQKHNLVMVTTHSYSGGAPDPKETVALLLKDSHAQDIANNLTQMVAWCKQRGLPLRLAEMNTLYAGGKLGVSNTFAAALWSLDIFFALAAVGVAGVNFQSPVNSNYGAFRLMPGSTGSSAVTRGAAPFYGHWLFRRATGGGARLIQVPLVHGVQGVRVWGVLTPTEVRLVVINKNMALTNATAVVLDLAGAGLQTTAVLSQLVAPSYASTANITLDGLSADPAEANYAFGDSPPAEQTVPVQGVLMGSGSGQYVQFQFRLQPVSAAMLSIAFELSGSFR